jgi:hypothetical protein
VERSHRRSGGLGRDRHPITWTDPSAGQPGVDRARPRVELAPRPPTSGVDDGKLVGLSFGPETSGL